MVGHIAWPNSRKKSLPPASAKDEVYFILDLLLLTLKKIISILFPIV